MDIAKAKVLAALVNRRDRYEVILKHMRSGYTDEWEFRNNHTGTVADFSCDDWAEIITMVQRKFNALTSKIEGLK